MSTTKFYAESEGWTKQAIWNMIQGFENEGYSLRGLTNTNGLTIDDFTDGDAQEFVNRCAEYKSEFSAGFSNAENYLVKMVSLCHTIVSSIRLRNKFNPLPKCGR